MRRTFKRNAIALVFAPALALPAAALQAAGDKQAQQQPKSAQQEQKSWVEKSRQTYDERTVTGEQTAGRSSGGKAAQPQSQKQQSQQAGQDLQKWDVAVLYRTGWSAEQMLDTEVRGENGEEIGEVEDIIVGKDGKISKIVVEAGGFFDIGDEHIGVPWKQVRIGPEMEWVQVPLREDNVGGFSLFTGEDVAMQESSWRVEELLGDYVSLRDIPRYGLARDVIFDSSGKALAVVVDRPAGTWGAGGRYAYPYTGYDRTAFAYPLPYRSGDLAGTPRFDYVLLGEQSPQARAPEERSERRSAAGASPQSGSGATGSSMSEPIQTQSFAALDRNNDGTLSMMEAAADPDAKQRFKELDNNNDSRLSRSEYEAR